MAGKQNFTVEKNAAFRKRMRYVGKSKRPINLDGFTAILQARATAEDPTVLFELTTDNGGITLSSGGYISLYMPLAKVKTLNFAAAVYDLLLIPADGEPDLCLQLARGSSVAMSIYGSFADVWNLDSRVTFDGIARRIIVNPGVSSLSVREDIYSAWKEWVQARDHAKFLPAIRTIGGDPLGGGRYAGDLYFLMNGWQIVISEATQINGVIYHDDGIDVFVIQPGGGVISTVSTLVQTVTTPLPVVAATADDIANAVWEKPVPTNPPANSFANLMAKKLLTVGKFLGLK